MTASLPVFVDTNVLVYAKLAYSPMHAAAVHTLRTLQEENSVLWISRQVMREYLAAMTRPNTLTEAIPIASLVADVTSFAAQFQVAEDGPQVTERLLKLLTSIPTAGKQVHDANIVATMQAYSLSRLVTHNTADFTRFSGLISILPLTSSF